MSRPPLRCEAHLIDCYLRTPRGARITPTCRADGWNCGFGCFVGIELHEPAQRFATARQPRANGPDGHGEYRCDLLVPHTFQADEKDGCALLFGEFGDCTVEIAQLEALSLVRRTCQERLGISQADDRSFANGAAHVIDVLVMENCK